MKWEDATQALHVAAGNQFQVWIGRISHVGRLGCTEDFAIDVLYVGAFNSKCIHVQDGNLEAAVNAALGFIADYRAAIEEAAVAYAESALPL